MEELHNGRGCRCISCGVLFSPNVRLGKRQKTCGQKACRKLWRARYRRRYRKKNWKEEREYRAKRASGYWKQYRENHPAYVQHNRAASRLRKELRTHGLQRQLDIVQAIETPRSFDAFREFATSHLSLLLQCSLRSAGEGRPFL